MYGSTLRSVSLHPQSTTSLANVAGLFFSIPVAHVSALARNYLGRTRSQARWFASKAIGKLHQYVIELLASPGEEKRANQESDSLSFRPAASLPTPMIGPLRLVQSPIRTSYWTSPHLRPSFDGLFVRHIQDHPDLADMRSLGRVIRHDRPFSFPQSGRPFDVSKVFWCHEKSVAQLTFPVKQGIQKLEV